MPWLVLNVDVGRRPRCMGFSFARPDTGISHEPAPSWPASPGHSLRFYATYFGFDPATASRYPDSTTVIRNADGFDLARHLAVEPQPPSGCLHLGFRVTDAVQVHALRGLMESDSVTVVERDDEPNLVSFKCLHPDGWRIEVYWEQP